MRSTSATSPVLRRRAALGFAAVVAASAAAAGSRVLADEKPTPPTAVVGWIDSKDPAIARDLFDGATLAIEAAETAGEARLLVRRGTSEGAWGTVAAAAVRLVAEEKAVVLVTPPEREAAHLLAQVGTKMRVPIVSTSRAPSVTQAGTTWLVRVVPRGDAADEAVRAAAFDPKAREAADFVRRFTERFRRAPTAWSVAGYDAARAIAAVIARRTPTDGGRLLAALRGLGGPPGATAPIRFDANGDRVETPADRR